MVPPTGQWKKKKKKKNYVHISEMWEQLELKVRFCKLKCTQSQESLHQILKWKRIFSHRDRRWWLTLPTSQVWILAPSCQGGHCQSRPNGHKSNNDPQPSLSNLCKSVQDFTKLNPQESSTDFDLQNPEISSTMESPRATIGFEDRGLLLHFCVNWATNSKNRNHH